MKPRELGRGFMPLAQWPGQDRETWKATARPAGLFDEASVAADWSPARRKIVEQAYGRWLLWLADRQLLDPTAPLADRITHKLLSEFVRDMGLHLAPATLVITIGGVKRMLEAIAPETSWKWMVPLYRNLKRTWAPVREKHARIVDSQVLFELGLRLFQDADQQPLNRRSAVHARNGLIISLLAARPVRLSNFVAIEIGRHLVRDGDLYRLAFDASETKVGRPIAFLCPAELTPYIDRYLDLYRPVLLENANSCLEAPWFWINYHGRQLNSWAMRGQIELCTKRAFGRKINPHLFRDCAATSIAVHDPEHVRIATVILGHARASTTNKHYNQAQMLTASRDYARELMNLRKKARSGPPRRNGGRR